MSPTIPYLNSPLVIIVPNGELYSSLEKLLKPFDFLTWDFVILYLLLSFVFIAIIKFGTNQKVTNFVLGSNSSSPYFNTIVAFIGQNVPDVRIPKRNFARTLFCIFMLYSLIIRNSYSGALFKFLKNDNLQKPHIQTVREMFDKNFKFYMNLPIEVLIKDFKTIYKNRVILNSAEIPSIYAKMTNPEFRGGLLSSLDLVQNFNRNNYKNFTVDICPQHLYSFQYVLYFQKNSALVEIFNKHLSKFAVIGILDNLVSRYLPPDFNHIKVKKAPKALNLNQVSGGFWILIYGISLACVFFIFEICVKHFHIIKKTISSAN